METTIRLILLIIGTFIILLILWDGLRRKRKRLQQSKPHQRPSGNIDDYYDIFEKKYIKQEDGGVVDNITIEEIEDKAPTTTMPNQDVIHLSLEPVEETLPIKNIIGSNKEQTATTMEVDYEPEPEPETETLLEVPVEEGMVETEKQKPIEVKPDKGLLKEEAFREEVETQAPIEVEKPSIMVRKPHKEEVEIQGSIPAAKPSLFKVEKIAPISVEKPSPIAVEKPPIVERKIHKEEVEIQTPISAEKPQMIERKTHKEEDKIKVEKRKPDYFISIRIIPRPGRVFYGYELLQVLLANKLDHGENKLFNRSDPEQQNKKLFSIASVEEPGEFDLKTMKDMKCSGMIVYMNAAEHDDPLSVFDDMLHASQEIVGELDGILMASQDQLWDEHTTEKIRIKLNS